MEIRSSAEQEESSVCTISVGLKSDTPNTFFAIKNLKEIMEENECEKDTISSGIDTSVDITSKLHSKSTISDIIPESKRKILRTQSLPKLPSLALKKNKELNSERLFAEKTEIRQSSAGSRNRRRYPSMSPEIELALLNAVEIAFTPIPMKPSSASKHNQLLANKYIDRKFMKKYNFAMQSFAYTREESMFKKVIYIYHSHTNAYVFNV